VSAKVATNDVMVFPSDGRSTFPRAAGVNPPRGGFSDRPEAGVRYRRQAIVVDGQPVLHGMSGDPLDIGEPPSFASASLSQSFRTITLSRRAGV
jgi:hypothetical protein